MCHHVTSENVDINSPTKANYMRTIPCAKIRYKTFFKDYPSAETAEEYTKNYHFNKYVISNIVYKH